MSDSPPSWEDFVERVANVAESGTAEIQPESRLVNDLDLDSLALIELVVAMVNDYGLSIPDGLDAQRWESLTAGQLYQAVQEGTLP